MAEFDHRVFTNAVVGWDVKSWEPILAYWESALKNNPTGKVLEIGCGPGGLSMWFERKGYSVLCTDLELPGEKVHTLHKQFEIKNIQYEALNALDLKYDGAFDVVVFKSVAGGVARNGQDENRLKMMEQIYRSLKPNGILVFAENIAASPFHKFFRKHFVKWGKSWNYASTDEMLKALSVFQETKYKIGGFLSAFGRTEWQRRLFAGFDRFFFNHFIPENWKYIMYGYARKSS